MDLVSKIETKDPNDILSSTNIVMSIEQVGCFGGSKQVIKIKGDNGIRTLTNSYIEGVGPFETTVPFDAEKEKILADLITAGHSIPDSVWCTVYSTYQIETEKYRCIFEDNTCSLYDYLEKLLE